MPSPVPMGYLSIAAIAFAVVGFVLLAAGLVALVRARPLRFALRSLLGLLLLALGVLAGGIAMGVQGYRALVHEEHVARVTVRPLAPQRFEAGFRFRDGRTAVYELAGDEVCVDAHVLKWKPVANLLGLHTLWSLDRVAGRYRSIEQERTGERTIHALAPHRTVDLPALRRHVGALAALYDAQYGSASFAPASGPAQYDLAVTTSGLIMRRVGDGR